MSYSKDLLEVSLVLLNHSDQATQEFLLDSLAITQDYIGMQILTALLHDMQGNSSFGTCHFNVLSRALLNFSLYSYQSALNQAIIHAAVMHSRRKRERERDGADAGAGASSSKSSSSSSSSSSLGLTVDTKQSRDRDEW